MREYVEWDQGPTRVHVHRRVLAGLDREPPGSIAGVVYGTVSGDDVVIEDYAIGAGSGGGPLEAVGYFRVAGEPDDADEEIGFGRLRVALVFRRGPEGVELERLDVRPESQSPPAPGLGAAAGTGAGHRVLYRAALDEAPGIGDEEWSWRRGVWPVAAVVVGLVIGAGAYMWMSGRSRQDPRAAEPIAEIPMDPIPAPPPAVTPAAPAAPAPKDAKETPPPAEAEADRLVEPGKPLTRAERAAIQREVKEALQRWSETRLR